MFPITDIERKYFKPGMPLGKYPTPELLITKVLKIQIKEMHEQNLLDIVRQISLS